MLVSPAKSLDFDIEIKGHYLAPEFLTQSQQLVNVLQGYTADQIADLMSISLKLGQLNEQRYQNFQQPFTSQNAKQALLAFQGDVYKGIYAADFTESELLFTQQHLRILSGLYGILKPLDLMQPYRLEMGTKLAGKWGKNLYEFWGQQLADNLNKQATDILVNLASQEYFKSVDNAALKKPVLEIAFKEQKGNDYKIVAIHAKKARGLMVRYVVKNSITDIEKLKDFNTDGYQYNDALSDQKNWVFTR